MDLTVEGFVILACVTLIGQRGVTDTLTDAFAIATTPCKNYLWTEKWL